MWMYRPIGLVSAEAPSSGHELQRRVGSSSNESHLDANRTNRSAAVRTISLINKPGYELGSREYRPPDVQQVDSTRTEGATRAASSPAGVSDDTD